MNILRYRNRVFLAMRLFLAAVSVIGWWVSGLLSLGDVSLQPYSGCEQVTGGFSRRGFGIGIVSLMEAAHRGVDAVRGIYEAVAVWRCYPRLQPWVNCPQPR